MANPWDYVIPPPQGQGPLLAFADPNIQQDPATQNAAMGLLPDIPARQPISKPQGAGDFTTSYQKQFDDAFKANMDRRDVNNEQLRAQLQAKLGQDTSGLQSMDLAPAMAYADSLMGTHTAGSYKSPTVIQDKKAEADKLQKALADGTNSSADDQLGYLKLKLQEELSKNQADKEDKKANRTMNTLTSGMRSQWLSNPTTKDSQNVAAAYEKIRNAAADPSPAGDLSLIFAYMKILDPGSTVREGEFANAQNAANVPDQVRNIWNKAKTGERLNPHQRADFIAHSEGLFKGQMDQQNRFNQGMIDVAVRAGINPNDVVLPSLFEVKPKGQKAAPKPQTALQVGTVEDGHQYVGGDPRNPSSWKAVK